MSEPRNVYRWVDEDFRHFRTGKRVGQESSLLYPDVHNPTAPQKIMMDERRRKALEIRMVRHEDGTYYTFKEVAEIMHANFPELLEGTRNYSPSTAYTDCMAGIRALHKDIKELASIYLIAELEKLDALDAANIRATEVLYGKLMDYDEETDDIESLISSLNKLSSSITRISDRKSKFLGLDAPKEVHAKTMSVNMTMDDFLEMKKRALAEFGDSLPPLHTLIDDKVKAIDADFSEEEE